MDRLLWADDQISIDLHEGRSDGLLSLALFPLWVVSVCVCVCEREREREREREKFFFEWVCAA